MSDTSVESGENATKAQDSQNNKTVAPQEDVSKKLADIQELNKHLTEEVNKWKNEAKNAFNKRDKKVEEVNILKDQDKLVAYAETLKAEKEKLEQELNNIRLDAERKTKMELVQRIAKEHGIKERYMGMLERHINIDDINVDKPITVKMAIESIKNDIPDFFGVPGETLDKSLPTAKPVLQVKERLTAEYNQLMNKSNRTKEDVNRLFELGELIKQA